MPSQPDPTQAQRLAEQALADCAGDKDAAILLLAHIATTASRGASSGFLRLGQPNGK